MGSHDDYGKAVLRLADHAIELDGPAVTVDLGGGGTARIDGALGTRIAIEIEARTPKQVRGAILDLLMHNAPKKLLILVPRNMHNPQACRKHCSNILSHFLPCHDYRVVLLEGTGEAHQHELDALIVRRALVDLGMATCLT